MLYLNGQPVPVTHFPDNTSQVWKLPDSLLATLIRGRPAFVKWVYSNEGEFMQLAQLKALLDTYPCNPRLEITYLPYGRQDKIINNECTFALRVFATMLNALCFNEVYVIDPHSDVAESYIENMIAKYPTKRVEEVAQEIGGDLVLCYPDKGAVSKYTEVYKTLYRPHVYGNKTRDQLTGNITGYELVGDVAGKNVLIVDDICDGGATFKILAKDLLVNGAKSVALFVTHGIFSKGVRTLMDAGIARVFTADCEVTARHNSQNI